MQPEGLGDEADKEVDRLMEELTAGVLDKNDPVPTNSGPVKQAVAQEEEQQKEEEVNEEENEELKKMQERLQSL